LIAQRIGTICDFMYLQRFAISDTKIKPVVYRLK
jgi:hypothetical protein